MVTFANSSGTATRSVQTIYPRFRGGGGENVGTETVCILGADGPLGRRMIEIAIDCGYQIQVLTSGHLDYSHSQLRIRKGCPLNTRDLRTVINGSSCVINLLNLSGHEAAKDSPRQTQYSATVTKMVWSAMQRQQIDRYLLVSHPSVVTPADRRRNPQGLASKYLWPLLHRRRWRDLQAEADLLRQTQLAWTLIRCPQVKDVDGYGPVDVDRHCPAGTLVSLDRLARFLIYQKDCQRYLRESVFVASRVSRLRSM
ncbi:NAD(P)H-binding [Neorhodopirellula lusitana]|uniref:NAD(P)H-binding n=1 Tax=Neorhodopirellula lusitana TaxID=445327 RepID=A0ABY1QF33_9BACT|nr:NAD(P)H-binding protein [Neorhodopirellula lusitana]SMP65920.1 NAD(P)H-binding [Neorhodopirellula lusitana]